MRSFNTKTKWRITKNCGLFHTPEFQRSVAILFGIFTHRGAQQQRYDTGDQGGTPERWPGVRGFTLWGRWVTLLVAQSLLLGRGSHLYWRGCCWSGAGAGGTTNERLRFVCGYLYPVLFTRKKAVYTRAHMRTKTSIFVVWLCECVRICVFVLPRNKMAIDDGDYEIQIFLVL